MRLIKGFELFNFSGDCPLDLNNFKRFSCWPWMWQIPALFCHAVLHSNLISCRVGFLLSCFYKSNRYLDVLCCYLFCFIYLFCKLWLCWVLIAAGAFFTDVDRFPWKRQTEFCVVRAKHKFKSLGFVCSPSFFSLPTARRLFLCGVIFTGSCISLALLYLRKNGGLLVV